MTTLMLGKLVDAGKLTWETPVTELLPSFRLGDAATTAQVRVKHLICACTGLPRQDYEWLFQYEGITPDSALATLGTMQPTSKFGEVFQYSNPLAAAAGFVGGHVAYPDLELGAAYDSAMRTLVFDPLGMKATTFDYAAALRADHAMPHSQDESGAVKTALMDLNYSIIPVRPAGAAWSNVRDMLAYVAMELANGKDAADSSTSRRRRCCSGACRRCRSARPPAYGMGLMVDTTWGVKVVHHGGDMVGFHSDMMWLPAQGVGAVVLTNGDPGLDRARPVPAQAARGAVRRPPRSRRPGGGAGEDVLRGARRGAEAAHRAGRPGRGRQAGRAIPQRGARRHRGEGGARDDGIRSRRVAQRDGVAEESRRDGLDDDHHARSVRLRVRDRRAATRAP